MQTFKVTFVQTTYVLVTFAHISNIKVITAPILTKNFGSKFLWGGLIFVHRTKYILDLIFLEQNFGAKNCCVDKKNLGPTIILSKLDTFNLSLVQFCCTKKSPETVFRLVFVSNLEKCTVFFCDFITFQPIAAQYNVCNSFDNQFFPILLELI